MKHRVIFTIILCLALPALLVSAQPSRDLSRSNQELLPLRRVSLYSSGVGFFQHSGTITGPAEINLSFESFSMNDVLASLILNDPASSSPSLSYASEGSLWRSLRSLRVDLSNPSIAEILAGQRGQEIEVFAPGQITGRIIGIEYRHHISPNNALYSNDPWLSILTLQGIRSIPVRDIISFSFTDNRLNTDLLRGLDLLAESHDEASQNMRVVLDGQGNRPVSISYIIPAAVWKVSYRLDLSPNQPLLQGWAIIDNDSDTDWEEVELSLVSGRQVSFVQLLYTPYRVFRPVMPLAIAGAADAIAHESGTTTRQYNLQVEEMLMFDSAPQALARSAPAPAAAPSLGGGALETAQTRAAGDQFEFTIRNPVTLERRQSAMLPLVEGNLQAERTLIFSGSRAQGGTTINPLISVELTNTLGMGLPAGPIAVFDGGTYAGDALIEFFPENERRLISFGEDLSVSGNLISSGSRFITGVNISGGVMTINRRQTHESTYSIRNTSDENKRLVIEHPITRGAELSEPQSPSEQTASLYRFVRNLAARENLSFTIREETPVYERITLAQMRPEVFLSYSTNQEIPPNVRSALTRAIELRRIVDAAELTQRDLEAQYTRFVSEQERIRRNLEAVGNQSPQGQEYLRRMTALDNDIDNINSRINDASEETRRVRREYDNYISSLDI